MINDRNSVSSENEILDILYKNCQKKEYYNVTYIETFFPELYSLKKSSTVTNNRVNSFAGEATSDQ